MYVYIYLIMEYKAMKDLGIARITNSYSSDCMYICHQQEIINSQQQLLSLPSPPQMRLPSCVSPFP